MSTAVLREVRLYGPLGRQFGRVFRLAVATPAEAVQALCAVLDGFERAFLGRDGRASYHVFVGRGALRRDIPEDEVEAPIGATDPIRFVPVIVGAKRQGGLQVVVGYALLWVGYALYATGYGYAVGAAVQGIGLSMIGSGIIALLSPQRAKSASAAAANTPSYAFDGPVNNVEQGGPVPLLMGTVFVGSTVVSQGLSSDDLIISATSSPPPAVGLPGWEPDYSPATEGGG